MKKIIWLRVFDRRLARIKISAFKSPYFIAELGLVIYPFGIYIQCGKWSEVSLEIAFGPRFLFHSLP